MIDFNEIQERAGHHQESVAYSHKEPKQHSFDWCLFSLFFAGFIIGWCAAFWFWVFMELK